MEAICNAISTKGFSEQTVELIDNYTQQIVNGKEDLTQFNQAEHAGLCSAGETLIGAYIVCDYAKSSLAASKDAGAGEVASPESWQIDPEQERLVEQWARAKGLKGKRGKSLKQLATIRQFTYLCGGKQYSQNTQHYET